MRKKIASNLTGFIQKNDNQRQKESAYTIQLAKKNINSSPEHLWLNIQDSNLPVTTISCRQLKLSFSCEPNKTDSACTTFSFGRNLRNLTVFANVGLGFTVIFISSVALTYRIKFNLIPITPGRFTVQIALERWGAIHRKSLCRVTQQRGRYP